MRHRQLLNALVLLTEIDGGGGSGARIRVAVTVT
jgi:hypothetical protein